MNRTVFLTHGTALLTGAAIAVAATYHPQSQAQTPIRTMDLAGSLASQATAGVASGDPGSMAIDEDCIANAFDPISGQSVETTDIQSDRGYREWLKREALKAPY